MEGIKDMLFKGQFKYDGDDFKGFKDTIESIVRMSKELRKLYYGKLMKPVAPTAPAADATEDALAAYNEALTKYESDLEDYDILDAKLMQIMRINCSEKVRTMIKSCKSSDEIMKTLEAYYNASSPRNQLRVTQAFMNFKVLTTENFQEAITRFENICNKLTGFGLEKSDEEKKLKFLSALPEELNNKKDIWMHDTNMTFMQLCSHVLQIEQEKSLAKLDKDTKKQTALIGKKDKKGDKKKQKDGSGKQKRIVCYRCDKVGHIARECRSELNRCIYCKKTNHNSEDCFFKKKNEDKKVEEGSSSKSTALVVLVAQHPHKGEETSWVIDSGASCHMTGTKDLVKNVREIEHVDVLVGSKQRLVGKFMGDVVLDQARIQNVMVVPGLGFNLISVAQLMECGAKVVFESKKVLVKVEDRTVMTAPRDGNGLWRIQVKPNPNTDSSEYALSCTLWHQRFGHVSMEKVRKMMASKLVEGCEGLKPTPIKDCDSCIKAKQKRTAFKTFGGFRSTRPLELVHTDLLQVNVPSVGNAHYVLTLIDDYTRYAAIRFLKKKSDASAEIIQWMKEAERETNSRLVTLRSDNGGEYSKIVTILGDLGIKWDYTQSYTPEMNGVAERYNGKLLEMVRSLMFDSKLPKRTWAELFNTANYLLNRTYHSTIKDIPYCKYFGRPSVPVRHYRRIGCRASVLKTEVANKHYKGVKRKLDERSEYMVLLGYEPLRQGFYRLYDPETKEVVSSRDVKFWEDIVEMKTRGKETKTKTEDEYEDLQVNRTGFEDLGSEEQTSQEKATAFLEDTLGSGIGNIRAASSSGENAGQMLDSSIHAGVEGLNLGVSQPQEARSDTSVGQGDLDPGDLQDKDVLEIILPERPAGTYYKLKSLVAMLALAVDHQDIEIPKDYWAAINSPYKKEWKAAMQREYDSLIANGTWVAAALPKNRKVVSGKWVYTLKRDQDGKIVKFKARFVARGFSQVQGLDYQETFSPTVRLSTLRILLAVATHYDWEISQIDYETAFLNGELEEDIYIEEPDGFEQVPGKKQVLKLEKALYGLKQAPREWNKVLHEQLIESGLTPCAADPGLYYADIEGRGRMYVTVYVDDLLCFYESGSKIAKKIQESIKAGFKSKDLGECKWILGIHVERDRVKRTTKISQKQYILKLLDKFGMTDCSPADTPLDSKVIYVKEGIQGQLGNQSSKDASIGLYQQAIGSLIYLMISTRPDICYAVTTLSRFMGAPKQAHWNGVKHILRYLKKTLDYGIIYDGIKSPWPVGYADANFASNYNDFKSIHGYLFSMSGGPVTWKSRKQSVTARSTSDAEYLALGDCGAEAEWLSNLIRFACIPGLTQDFKVKVYGDNQSALFLAKNPAFSARTRHIGVQYHYIRELVSTGVVELEYVKSQDNVADMFTKSLPGTVFHKLLESCSVGPYASHTKMDDTSDSKTQRLDLC